MSVKVCEVREADAPYLIDLMPHAGLPLRNV